DRPLLRVSATPLRGPYHSAPTARQRVEPPSFWIVGRPISLGGGRQYERRPILTAWRPICISAPPSRRQPILSSGPPNTVSARRHAEDAGHAGRRPLSGFRWGRLDRQCRVIASCLHPLARVRPRNADILERNSAFLLYQHESVAIERSGGLAVSIEVIFVRIVVPAVHRDVARTCDPPDVLSRWKQARDDFVCEARFSGSIHPTVRFLCPSSPARCKGLTEGPVVDRIGGHKGACHARARFKRSFDRKLKGSHPAALDCGEKLGPACGIAFLHFFRETLERLRPPLFKIDGRRINA